MSAVRPNLTIPPEHPGLPLRAALMHAAGTLRARGIEHPDYRDRLVLLRREVARLVDLGETDVIDRQISRSTSLIESQILFDALDHLMDIQQLIYQNGRAAVELWGLTVHAGWLKSNGGELTLGLGRNELSAIGTILGDVFSQWASPVRVSQRAYPLRQLCHEPWSRRLGWVARLATGNMLDARPAINGRFQAVVLPFMLTRTRADQEIPVLTRGLRRRLNDLLEPALLPALCQGGGRGHFVLRCDPPTRLSSVLRWGFASHLLMVMHTPAAPMGRPTELYLMRGVSGEAPPGADALATARFTSHPLQPDDVSFPVRPWDWGSVLKMLRAQAPAWASVRLPS
jgi:hypothetical protein